MWRRAVALVVLVAIAAWWLTRPITIDELPAHSPNVEAGERQFWLGGCASCHARPVDGRRARGDAKLILGGGLELDTPYGTFRAPNISPHPDDGIGAWTPLDFVNAMQRGVSPTGRHYYPAFPYTSYAKMPVEHVLDLKAYLDTLPAVEGGPRAHSLSFPWSVSRGIGAWKRLYLDDEPVLATGDLADEVALGRQLVEGAGHCGECHTPRNALGGLRESHWLAGAPNLEGEGRVPNITPGGEAVGEWSIDDLAYYFESGFTPEFDTVGGNMVAVQENLAELTPEDRRAIAAYLKRVPAMPRDER